MVGTPANWAKQLILAKRYHLADPKICNSGYSCTIVYDAGYNRAPANPNECVMKMLKYILTQINSTGKDMVLQQIEWSPNKYSSNYIKFQHDILPDDGNSVEILKTPGRPQTKWEQEKQREREKAEHDDQVTKVFTIFGLIVLAIFIIVFFKACAESFL